MEYLKNDYNITSASIWIDKYCPRRVSDVIGNEQNINIITTWLNLFETNKKNFYAKLKKSRSKKKVDSKKAGKKKVQIIDPISNSDEDTTKQYQTFEDFQDQIDDNLDIYATYFKTEKKNKKSKAEQPKSCLLITGSHGIGKTCVVHAILNTFGYSIQILNFGKIKTNKHIKEIIEKKKRAFSTDLSSIVEERQNTKTAIVIDELEAITSPMGKNCVLTLLKHNEENWICPVIFISNNQHNKLLSDIKKNSFELRFTMPSRNDMFVLLKRIAETENIKISGLANHNLTIVNQIIDHSQFDYRRLITILQNLKYEHGENIITFAMVNTYCESSKRKDEDFDLFKATNVLLQKYDNIETCLKFYETDKVLLPLMMHENYLECIKQKCTDTDKKFKLVSEISEMLSEGDRIENYIYGDQNWDINEVHGFLTCVAPSYILCNNMKEQRINLQFPLDLNKASIGKINKKNIFNADKCFKDKNIDDYIYINLIIRSLIDEGQMEECSKLLGDSVSLPTIESLLKVDKIKSSKTNLTSKQKKEISSYLQK